MLVGTNLAIRISALDAVEGFSDSITEDMATGLRIHATKNPVTHKRWRSAYIPDVVAIGQGPTIWGQYLNQQIRWSRGTFDLLTPFGGEFWKLWYKLSPGKILHYLLIMGFYPSVALGWLLGVLNSVLVLGFNAGGLVLPGQEWLGFYGLTTFVQLSLYMINRKYNVSPFEHKESSGILGMAMSILSAPMYALAFLAAAVKRKSKFIVTPKDDAKYDQIGAFKRHLGWFAVLGATIAVASIRGSEPLIAYLWPAFMALIRNWRLIIARI